MGTDSKREYLKAIQARYRPARKKAKQAILDFASAGAGTWLAPRIHDQSENNARVIFNSIVLSWGDGWPEEYFSSIELRRE